MVTYTNYSNGYVVEFEPNCFKSWLLIPAQNLWPEWLRGVLYVAAILYLFLGIAIIADMFMLSIEMITSKKRIIYTFDMGKKERVQREVFVWNETIANLTLMALGSSAPEILISVFETLATLDNTKPSDSLGLFTIVGSASYNLLVITAICVMAVPSNSCKSIKEFGVFLITSIWSLFAYIWLLIVVKWSSPDVIELWEALVTLLFFPLLVVTAWLQDRGCWIYKCKKAHMNSSTVTVKAMNNANNNTTDFHQSRNGDVIPMTHLVDFQNTKAQLHHRKHSTQEDDNNEEIKNPDLRFGAQKHFQLTTNRAYARARFRHGVILAITGKKNGMYESNVRLADKQASSEKSKIQLSDIRDIHSGSFCFSSGSYSATKKSKYLQIDVLLNRKNKIPLKVGFSHIVDAARKKSLLDQRSLHFNSVQLTSHSTLSPKHSLPNVGEITDIEHTCQWNNSPTDSNKSDTKSLDSPNKCGTVNVTIIQNGNAFVNQADKEDDIVETPEVIKRRKSDVEYDFQFLQHASLVRYETRDGNGKSNQDYVQTSGTLVFDQYEYRKSIIIPLISNDGGGEQQSNEEEQSRHNGDGWAACGGGSGGDFVKDFYVLLRDPCHDTILSDPSITHVTIINNNQPGEFIFQEPTYHVEYNSNNVPIVTANVVRIHGSDGKSTVYYRTINGTAIGGDLDDLKACKCDFEGVEKAPLTFAAGETSKKIVILINPEREKTRNFIITLYDVVGSAKIGHRCATIVSLSSDVDEIIEHVTSLVDREKNDEDVSLKQQFKQQLEEAMSLDSDSSAGEMCLHFLSFFWKVVFAAVPPRSVWGGWAAFIVSLAMLGFLSALVEQFAKLLGCVIGLHVSITGITLVALGTSMPDTFASKTAALHDDSADAAIGNITGSNSVNVFLGLGLPWVIKSVYLASKGKSLALNGNNILFSVLVFLCCGIITLLLLVARRTCGGGELGGRASTKIFTGMFMIFLWFLFVLCSSLQAYGVIKFDL